MEIKNRLIQFIQHKQMTVKAFEESCGMSNGYVSSMRKGLGAEKLNNVLTKYPDLNREWLLYGEGPMLLTDATGSATDGMGEDGLKERITALERMLDERDARIAELEGRQEERLNAMQGNIDSLTSALNKALDLVKNSGK